MKPVTLLAVCVVLLVMAVPSAIANNAPDDEDWKNDALRTAVFRGEYKAAIHVRYHEKLASKYGESDEQWRWASIVLGVLAFAGPFVFKISREWASVAKAAWYVAGLVALLVAIYATFNGAADRFNREALQEQRWNDLHASWEKLLRERDEIPRGTEGTGGPIGVPGESNRRSRAARGGRPRIARCPERGGSLQGLR